MAGGPGIDGGPPPTVPVPEASMVQGTWEGKTTTNTGTGGEAER